MTLATDNRPDNDDSAVCSVCGRSLADNMIPHSSRCDLHHRYHPADPSAPALGVIDQDEAERHCSASHGPLILLARRAIAGRRSRHAA